MTQQMTALQVAAMAERKRMADLARGRFAKAQAVFTVPDRVCNSSSTENYTGPKWPNARPEGDAFLTIKSRGV